MSYLFLKPPGRKTRKEPQLQSSVSIVLVKKDLRQNFFLSEAIVLEIRVGIFQLNVLGLNGYFQKYPTFNLCISSHMIYIGFVVDPQNTVVLLQKL